MKQPVFVRVLLNSELVNVLQFSGEEQIVIGKNTDVHITLPLEGVAPLHAVIEERDSGFYISDLGSKFGTFKNNQKTFDDKLETGDLIKIGPYVLEFYIGVPKPTAVPKGVISSASAMSSTSAATTKSQLQVSASSLDARFKESSGNIVEVVIAWGDRVLATHHFEESQEVTIGSDTANTIVFPLVGAKTDSHPLLIMTQTVRVCLTPEMTGDYFKGEEKVSFSDLIRKGRVLQVPSGSVIDIVSGEAVALRLQSGITIYVRFVNQAMKPILAPLLDLTRSEKTALVMSFVVTGFLMLLMAIYTPPPLEEQANLEEPLRKVTVKFNIPKPIVQVADTTTQSEKKVIQVPDKAKVAQTTKQDPGSVSEIKPNPAKTKKNQVSSAVDKGAAIKTGKNEGANAQSKNRDVMKEGLLSALAGGGTQKELSKAYSGSGELQGMADAATGTAGSIEDRAGDNLGSRLKNQGVGGKGTSNVGYQGVGTKGKGSGTFGYGTGGIGAKGKEDINIEGAEAEFTGSIDRDAIRRVIQENRRAFKFCYETALRRNSDLYGKVEIQWDIIEKGRVMNAHVKSNTVGDKELGRCIVTKISGLTFPEPPADQVARVVYPFVFAAQ